jgi:hypothetical protein
MQEPEIDNGRLNDVSAEGADGLSLPDLSDLMQAGGAGEGADHQIDPVFLTTRSALEQAWSDMRPATVVRPLRVSASD